LWNDIDLVLPWANDLFGTKPEYCNLWLGESRSVSSTHKDQFENLYAVVVGEKHFTLFHPSNIPFLYERRYRQARWSSGYSKSGLGITGNMDPKKWKIVPSEPPNDIPWISVNPDEPNLKTFPLYRYAKPVHAVVRAGDVLYLPSMWYHHVRQQGDEPDGKAIAINYWYDMQFDSKYAYFDFLHNCATTTKF